MNKESIITIFALALIGSLAVAAKPPSNKSLTFIDNGTTMSVSGSLAGLAGDLELTLSATGMETTACPGPGGISPPPQQVVLTGAQVVTVPADPQLAATFDDLASSAPPPPACAPSDGDALATLHDVAFTNVAIQIRPVQPDPALAPLKPVRCIQCSFSLATLDGPAAPQSCFTMSSC